jgi:hypothetical protein
MSVAWNQRHYLGTHSSSAIAGAYVNTERDRERDAGAMSAAEHCIVV